MENEDVKKVKTLAKKIVHDAGFNALDLVDELEQWTIKYPNDYTLGMMVKSLIYQTKQEIN
jgi:hypothetical protein